MYDLFDIVVFYNYFSSNVNYTSEKKPKPSLTCWDFV